MLRFPFFAVAVFATTLLLQRDVRGESFRAGAATINIDPIEKESIIAGGFLEGRGNVLQDSLWVRAIVLDDTNTQLALVVVDTCMMEQSLIDAAKAQASRLCGIPASHMLVSATHTHSAPAAMGCLGTRQDAAYAAMLPGRIAEAIVAAHGNLQPARIGWGSIDDWEHTHNRRWIRRQDRKIVDPFGEPNGLANMHPGYQSPDAIGPSGPVDPSLSLISLQTLDGKPIAVYANYSQHYFGTASISADYYGLFCKYVAQSVGEIGDGNGPFVCALSQGTSGDLMWMDYGSPARGVTMAEYAAEVARYAEKGLDTIEYHSHAELAVEEQLLPLRYRVPDEARRKWAEPIAAKIENDLPKNVTEVYAREALILHDRQQTQLKLQALRIGDLTIAALPNEVYALTGLKLKRRSPAQMHFNVELANGAEGYIPPPEQHRLGGYTTWPARTAGLEVTAEPKIVEALVEAMERATGEPRRDPIDDHGPYAKRILDDRPLGYWRLNEDEGIEAHNAVTGGKQGQLLGAFAWYLPGVGSGTGIGLQEHLVASSFSGPNGINRAIHFVDGRLLIDDVPPIDRYTLSYWFWLGERSSASDRHGILSSHSGGETIRVHQFEDHSAEVTLTAPIAANIAGVDTKTRSAVSERRLRADQWNAISIVRDGDRISVYLNGTLEPSLSMANVGCDRQSSMQFGAELQGKLDEVAFFDRALSRETIESQWRESSISASNAKQDRLLERVRPGAGSGQPAPEFREQYAPYLRSLQPMWYESFDANPSTFRLDGRASFTKENFGTFQGGRCRTEADSLGASYSVSFWFKNRLPNSSRPVTAYLFSRGPADVPTAPGDHLGIGGTHLPNAQGKLILFNGNQRDELLVGRTLIEPGSWNHVVLIRDRNRARVYLNGGDTPDLEGEIDSTAIDSGTIFLGARNDNFAPLQGNIAHAVFFHSAVDGAIAKKIFSNALVPSANPSSSSSAARATQDSVLSGPRGAIESLDYIHVPPGFQVNLAACEPQVLDPVAMDWDASLRMWVVEMADYPLGMDGRGAPGGRIRRLEDKDRDGFYESSILFDDGLNFPTGILCWRDGVLVTAAPTLWFLRDEDGDGRVDSREALLEGFNEGNQQLRLNHLRIGLDGWVYCANGGHHPNHGLGTKVISKRNGKTYEIGSRDFRFKPDTGEVETESGPSQYGRNRDAWGHWFGTQNANPLWHYVLPIRYLERNPHVATNTTIKHLVGPGSPPVYPASSLEKRFHSFEQSGHFTSACSGMIYGDDLLFGKEKKVHAFTCEPFHNLVQHNVLTEDGVSFRASRPIGEGKLDFFASEDRWCRPVMVRTGPDGALWIADMVRYMIEHPEWLPAEGRSELEPHYRLGDNAGRIYRVTPASGAVGPEPLDPSNGPSLVSQLQSSNDWVRTTAHAWLLWNHDTALFPELELLARLGTTPESRYHAICILDSFERLTDKLLIERLRGEAMQSPRVLEGLLRIAEKRQTSEVVLAASEASGNTDSKVCLQLAFSCGEWENPMAAIALTKLAERFYQDPYFRSAIMSSALVHAKGFAKGISTSQPEVVAAFRVPLLRQSLAVNDHDTIAILVASAIEQAKNGRGMDQLDLTLLELQRLGVDLRNLAAQNPGGEIARSVAKLDAWATQLQATAESESVEASTRIAALVPLSRMQPYRSDAVQRLSHWMDGHASFEQQRLAMSALAQSGHEKVPEIFAKSVSSIHKELLRPMMDAWLTREAWVADLLDRFEASEISPVVLDATQQARLLDYPIQELANRYRALPWNRDIAAREEVYQGYTQVLELSGDPIAGRAVYSRACASCHRRGEQVEGPDVGPNLASVVGHSKEKLLRNILIPSADVQPGYYAYSCLLESGEVVSGVLVSETSTSVAIKQTNAEVRGIPRSEIDLLRNTNRSLMPDGLEASIDHQQMADLIAYLQGMISAP